MVLNLHVLYITVLKPHTLPQRPHLRNTLINAQQLRCNKDKYHIRSWQGPLYHKTSQAMVPCQNEHFTRFVYLVDNFIMTVIAD